MLIPRKEFEERQERIRKRVEADGLAGLLVYSNAAIPGNVQYVSDYAPLHPGGYQSIGGTKTVTMGNAMLAFPLRGEPVLFTNVPWLADSVKAASVINSVATFDYAKAIEEVLKVSQGMIGVCGWDIFPASVYERLRQRLPNLRFEESMIIEEMRMVKSEAELRLMRESARIAGEGLQAGVNTIQEGRTEIDLANSIERCFMEANPYYAGFMSRWAALSLVGCGGRTGIGGVAPVPTLKKLVRGDLVNLDISPEYDGYAGDISRAKVLGTPSQDQKELFNAVLEIQKKCLAMIRPGVIAKELQDTAYELGNELGYGEYVVPLVTHGIGLIIHERPDAGVEETRLAPNMVISCEPAIATGKLGVRIEDMVRVTDTGNEILTSFNKTLEI